MPSAVTRHLNQYINLITLPPTAQGVLYSSSETAEADAQTGHGREETIDHLFSNHLAHLRCMAGLTQKDLAEQLNVTPQSCSNWETKTSRPNFETKAAAVEACLSIALESASADLDRAFRANAESAETSDAADVADFLDRMTKYLFPRRGVALARFLATRARENDHSELDTSTNGDRPPSAPTQRQSIAGPAIPMSQLPPYLTLEQVVANVLPVTINTIRWWVQTDKDGFDTECVVRRGRRVFVKKDALTAWLDSDPSRKE